MNARKWIVALSVALLVLFSFNVTAFAAPANQMPFPASYYVVRPGDTLFSIAMRYNTSVWTIARANGIMNPSIIFRGQVLVIPAAGPIPGPFPPAPRPIAGPMVHVVRWGENLFGIAAMYGVNAWSVAQANGLANPNYIFAGQRLLIPMAGPMPGPVGYGQWNTPNFPTVSPYSGGYNYRYTFGTPAGYGY